MRYRLLMGRQALTELAQHGAFAKMVDAINQRQQRLDDALYRLERAERQVLEHHRRRWELAAAAVRHYDVRRMLESMRQELAARISSMSAVMENRLLHRRNEWERASASLEALSPLAILNRGYALVFDSSGRLLKDAGKLKAGEEITARVAHGNLTATVKKIAPEN